jgi:class 3 adenylate cyclase
VIDEDILEGGDVFGRAVVAARRLCDAADEGQIVVSDLVRLLVGEHDGIQLTPLGPRVLKGLPAPMLAHAAAWHLACGW